MSHQALSYRGHRFPPQIISYAVWLYYRFSLSFRDVEDLLAERGVTVSYEAIRQWCGKFGSEYARRIKRRAGRLGDIWYLDEMFVKVQGREHYLWRAVDQEGDVLDILVQSSARLPSGEAFLPEATKAAAGRNQRSAQSGQKSGRALAWRKNRPSESGHNSVTKSELQVEPEEELRKFQVVE